MRFHGLNGNVQSQLLLSEIEDLSNEILQSMRHEPMSLQPQAGFGSAQEEVDRIYDYMRSQIKCNDLHYVGTANNNGKYQDGAYAVCLDVRIVFSEFVVLFLTLGGNVAGQGHTMSRLLIRN